MFPLATLKICTSPPVVPAANSGEYCCQFLVVIAGHMRSAVIGAATLGKIPVTNSLRPGGLTGISCNNQRIVMFFTQYICI